MTIERLTRVRERRERALKVRYSGKEGGQDRKRCKRKQLQEVRGGQVCLKGWGGGGEKELATATTRAGGGEKGQNRESENELTLGEKLALGWMPNRLGHF